MMIEAWAKSYQTWLFQQLTPYVWKVEGADLPKDVPAAYPAEYIVPAPANAPTTYLDVHVANDSKPPPRLQLDYVFDTLGQDPDVVLLGQDGWHLPSTYAGPGALAAAEYDPPVAPARRGYRETPVDATATVVSDDRGQTRLRLRLTNRGASKVTNVQVAGARLHGRHLPKEGLATTTPLPDECHHLACCREKTIDLVFPLADPAAAASTTTPRHTVLRVTVSHAGGTIRYRVRVRLRRRRVRGPRRRGG
jgi:hypothetical protein